ncbi:hypothetical protein [Pelosinus sp. sgz500959]|uniref:hypothetical protein n=1 Tax=Pelosinus sp. sgz500959 TaxID=3242472 RepID=UPI00366C52F6
MAAKIIPFPIQNEQPLEEIDRYIRDYLAEIEADRDFIDYISNRMNYFIKNYANQYFEPTFDLVVPPNMSREQADALLLSIEMGVEHTAKQVQDMVGKIILERLQLEVELYEKQKNMKVPFIY